MFSKVSLYLCVFGFFLVVISYNLLPSRKDEALNMDHSRQGDFN